MVPIELAWFVIVLIFGFIGIVRGFLKELGVTTVMVVMLFGVTNFESRITPMLVRVGARLVPGDIMTLQAAFWVIAIACTAFVSYHGDTLAFEGKLVKGALGLVFNLGTGLVNGYLIAGSIWYYLDRLHYPLLNIKPENLSALAQTLIPLLPPRLLAPYLLYLLIFLVLMRVIR